MKKTKTKEPKVDTVKLGKIISLKKDFIKNLMNGRYFLGRCNMMQEQLVEGGKIIENIDGCLKSRDLMLAEYGLMRMQAIDSLRLSNFAKRELKDNHGITDYDLQAIEARYYEGKIIDEDDNENFRIPNKAEFTNETEK